MWLWVEAMSQPNLEQSLEIGGFGYPAMATFNTRKGKFSLLRGSFSEDGTKEFLRNLYYGKGSLFTLPGDKLPDVEKKDPWDGKDGELPVEEDIDLSDVELDDFDTQKEEL